MIAINTNSRDEVFVIDPAVRTVYVKSMPAVKSRGKLIPSDGSDSPDLTIERMVENHPVQPDPRVADQN